MKRFFSICLLFVFSSGLANCPSKLAGHWEGNYTDHGPFGRTLLIGLKIIIQGKHFSGSTLSLKNQPLGLAKLSLKGTCSTSGLQFTLTQNQETATAPFSQIRFINPNQIQVTLHWQTAMISGYGQALLERQQ